MERIRSPALSGCAEAHAAKMECLRWGVASVVTGAPNDIMRSRSSPRNSHYVTGSLGCWPALPDERKAPVRGAEVTVDDDDTVDADDDTVDDDDTWY